MDQIRELERKIDGYLYRALEIERQIADGTIPTNLHGFLKAEMNRKLEMAEFAMKRLEWLRIGGK